jgi:hypothetical protein
MTNSRNSCDGVIAYPFDVPPQAGSLADLFLIGDGISGRAQMPMDWRAACDTGMTRASLKQALVSRSLVG